MVIISYCSTKILEEPDDQQEKEKFTRREHNDNCPFLRHKLCENQVDIEIKCNQLSPILTALLYHHNFKMEKKKTLISFR